MEKLEDEEKYCIISTHIIDEAGNVFEKVLILENKNLIIDEEVSTLQEKALIISGDGNVISEILKDKNIIDSKTIGGAKIFSIYDYLTDDERMSLKSNNADIHSIPLQDLFVLLTEKEEKMEAIKRSLKFQLVSFFKSWIIAMAIGLVVTILINFITINHYTRSLVPISYAYMLFGVLTIFVSVVLLIVQCFMCFYENYRIATRLGITRKNFFISNLIFFLIIILIFSAIFSGIISTGVLALEDMIDLEDMVDLEEFKSEISKETDLSEEEINRYIEKKQGEFTQYRFSKVFPMVFSFLLSLVGFWILVGFLFFALQMKAILIVIPLVMILGVFNDLSHDNSFLESILMFIVSQGVIAFGTGRLEERI